MYFEKKNKRNSPAGFLLFICYYNIRTSNIYLRVTDAAVDPANKRVFFDKNLERYNIYICMVNKLMTILKKNQSGPKPRVKNSADFE